MKECSSQQIRSLELLDTSLDQLKLFNKIVPESNAVEVAKQEVFKHYYNCTREVIAEEGKPLVIKHDMDMINILSGKHSAR